MSANGHDEVLKLINKISAEKSNTFVTPTGELVREYEYALAA